MSERAVVSEEESALVGARASWVTLFLLSGGALLYLVVVVAQRGWRRWRQRRVEAELRRSQLARLEAWLGDEGVSELAPGDARRVTAERRFWREEQERAVSALRERFAQEPTLLPLHAALAERVRHHRASLRMVAVGLGLALLVGGGLTLVGQSVGIFIIAACIASTLLSGLAAMTAIGVEGVMITQRRAEQRRVFTAARRRIFDMAELAGGLSLVDDAEGGAIIGALSPAVAQDGALELAEEVR